MILVKNQSVSPIPHRFCLMRDIRVQAQKKVPRWLLRILDIFDREARGMLALVGMYLTADNSKTRDTFDWTPILIRQSLIETAVAVQNIRNK